MWGIVSGFVLLALCTWVPLASFAQGNGAPLRAASGIAFDASGNLFIADASGNRVFEATLGGSLVVVAGTGVQGYGGDGGPAISAELNSPQGLAVASDGTVYIADTGNQRVRAVSAAGVISTIAGTGALGFSGEGGPAVAARLRRPTALAIDNAGSLLVCDTGNQRVRRITAGVITTFAGMGLQGFYGDGGQAKDAELDTPSGLTVASDGRVFVADAHNHRVRVVGPDGVIETFVGTGVPGFSGDGEPALKARLFAPQGLAWTASGDLLIADAGNERVRAVDGAGVITTLSGSGTEGLSSDGAQGLQAGLRAPRSVAVSSFGLPVIADTLNGTVRELAGGSVLFQPAALAKGRASVVSLSSPSSQVYGQGTVLLSVAAEAGEAQGALQLSDGGKPWSGGVLSGGSAAIDLGGLAAGQHTLSAIYAGDGLNPAAVSSAVNVEVQALAISATAASASVAYGLPLPPLSGVVSGILPQDTGQVNAVFTADAAAMPDVGIYPIRASLAGPKALNYTVGMTPVSGALSVVRAGTRVALGSTGQTYAGLPLSLTASVASTTSGAPTGSVEFLDGETVVATAPLAGGSATVTLGAAVQGSKTFSVIYQGDSNFLPGTSPAENISVLALPDFTVAPSGSSTATTSAGGNATFNLAVSGLAGAFTGAISFSGTGLPPGAKLTFSPPQVVPGAGVANVSVAVQTPASSARLGGTPSGPWFAGALCCLALLKRRGKRRPSLWILSITTLLLTGCGARTVGEGSGGVLAQTYTLQITGTGTNLAGAVVTHATALTLTVQQ